jgi:transposase
VTDILDLAGWNAVETRRDGDEYVIEAEHPAQPTACQKCGVIGGLYKHGPQPVHIRDSPIRGRPVRILVKAQRYRCRDCGGTFIQPLGGVHPETRMTVRCVHYIQEQCLRDTFLRIAEHIGCDDKTIRNLAGDYIEQLNAAYKPALPVWLGIDETQIDGKMRLVITDVGNRKPIDMLPDRDKDTLTHWLHRFKDRSMVKGVATDMWAPYKAVSNHMLPGVPVVIDKFHVVRMANYCMERVRIRLQKNKKAGVRQDWLQSKHILNLRGSDLTEKQRFNRDMWLDNEPELAEAYRLKEAFYAIYELPKADAEPAFDGFAATVPPGLKADFKVLTRAMGNWRTEILAYFDHPITNAYTEALNGVAKAINRWGRGYSFEVLRARVLYRHKPERTIAAEPGAMFRVREEAAHDGLIEALGSRCESCRGVFEPADLNAHHIRAV